MLRLINLILIKFIRYGWIIKAFTFFGRRIPRNSLLRSPSSREVPTEWEAEGVGAKAKNTFYCRNFHQ